MLFDSTTLPHLVAAKVVYSFLPIAMALLKRGSKGELSLRTGRKQYEKVQSLIEDLKKVRSLKTLPGWAQWSNIIEVWSQEAAQLIRNAASKMLVTWQRFCTKDKDVDESDDEDVSDDGSDKIVDRIDRRNYVDLSVERCAAPISNDYTESLMASGASLLGRLTGINPARATSIAQHKHNSGSLRRLRACQQPTEDEVVRAKVEAGQMSPAAVEWGRVHETKKREQIRSSLKKRRREHLREMLIEQGVSATEVNGMLKPMCIEWLTDSLYEPPRAQSSPNGREPKRRATAVSLRYVGTKGCAKN